MPGGSPAEPLKAEAVPFENNRGARMTEDGLPEIDWDSLTFSFTETDRMYIATCNQGDDWGQGKMQDLSLIHI